MAAVQQGAEEISRSKAKISEAVRAQWKDWHCQAGAMMWSAQRRQSIDVVGIARAQIDNEPAEHSTD